MEFETQKARRDEFLRGIYERARGSSQEDVNVFEVGDSMQLDISQTKDFATYWKAKDHIDLTLDGTARLRPSGIDYVESMQVPSNPPTETNIREEDPTENIFRQEGDYWTLQYEGDCVRLKDMLGLAYIAYLLGNAGKRFASVELTQVRRPTGSGTEPQSLSSEGLSVARGIDFGPDDRAVSDYKHELERLMRERVEAEAAGDVVSLTEIDKETAAIEDQLKEWGLGGRPRLSGSPDERARKAVSKAIHRALEKIREGHPALGEHLDRYLLIGVSCTYTAVDYITWHF